MPEFREADRPILAALSEWCARQRRRGWYDFARPLDIGGHGTSGHSQALTRLVKLGLVERQQRTDTGNYIVMRSRASYEYRITEKGISFLEELERRAS
jgi:DNA-binding PadR family transcriptional regulator